MQHLVDQVRGARQAALQLLQRALAFAVVACPHGDLELRLQGGERGAQLVRGIGREAAFGFECRLDAAEQAVQGFQHGPDFLRGRRRRQRLQLLRRTAGDLARDALQWCQALPRREPDPEPDQGQAEEGGHEQAPGDVADQVVADVVVFADLDLQAALAVPAAEVAPVAVVAARFGKAGGRGQGGFRRVARAHHQLAVGAPDLEAQAALILVGGFAEILDVVVAVVCGEGEQGLRRLGELGVEQFIDFVVRVDVAEHHGDQPGRGDAAEQQGEQAAAQREPDGAHFGMV